MTAHFSHTMPRGIGESAERSKKLSAREARLLESLLDKQSQQLVKTPSEEQAQRSTETLSGGQSARTAEATSGEQSTTSAKATSNEKAAQAAQDSSPTSLLQELKLLAAKLGAMAVVAVLLLSFVFGVHYNTDADMHPAIKDGDLVLYNRWSTAYSAGDLAVLSYQGQTQVRRVIAVAGDTVDITREGLIVNGALKQENEITEMTQRYAGGIDFPITLQENEIFVLGDARGGATDSRIYGLVQVDDTRGTVLSLIRRRGL